MSTGASGYGCRTDPGDPVVTPRITIDECGWYLGASGPPPRAVNEPK